jgi:hypothetical protein
MACGQCIAFAISAYIYVSLADIFFATGSNRRYRTDRWRKCRAPAPRAMERVVAVVKILAGRAEAAVGRQANRAAGNDRLTLCADKTRSAWRVSAVDPARLSLRGARRADMIGDSLAIGARIAGDCSACGGLHAFSPDPRGILQRALQAQSAGDGDRIAARLPFGLATNAMGFPGSSL